MRRWLVMFTVLNVFLLLILPACGGGEEEKTAEPTTVFTTTPTATLQPTATPTVTATVTPTTTSLKPVKIGVICAWSGPMAVAGGLADQIITVVEQQVKDMGGILGGRQVKFIRGDDRGAVAESVGQARKLALEENVDILAFGGSSGSSYNAVAQAAEELKVPYVAPALTLGQTIPKYSISITSSATMIDRLANFPIEFVKPKTIAWLGYDLADDRVFIDGEEGVVGARERWKNAGINIIYEQYFPQDTTDFSSYLTMIKFKKPDLVIISTNSEVQAIVINKQIIELGGWGDLKVWSSTEPGSSQKVVSMTAALGIYVSVLWMPSSDEPGMKAFEDAFKKVHGRSPSPELTYFYNDFWTAIKAIELAGTTDRDKVAQAMRSGNLEWDSAWGHLHIPQDGKGIASMIVAQVQEGGKLVKIWP